MFETFTQNYKIDNKSEQEIVANISLNLRVKGWEELLQKFSGCSFNNGLYRVHKSSQIGKWTTLVGKAFPEYKDRIICFSYDWLGRHFALDKHRVKDGEPLVMMLEAGTGEALEIPVNLIQFHNLELVEYREEALAYSFYNSWLEKESPPLHSECIGYKTPLYLNGSDTLENLETVDMEVYWEVSKQLIVKTLRSE